MKKFFRISLISFKALLGWLDPKLYVIYKIVDPALQMIFYTLLIQFVYKSQDITPWILGNAFLLCTKNAVFAVGTMLRNDRDQGTLQLIIASPANKLYVYIARVFFNVLDASLTVVIGLVIGVIFFGLDFTGINILLFTLSILTAMVGGMGIGLVLGSIALVMREIHLFLNVANMMLYILTGASFSRERLPSAMYFLSNIIPLTRSIDASRIIMEKGNLSTALQLLGVDLAIGSIYILIGFTLYGYFEYKARVSATLEAY
ncbi:ABC transporter permease [Alkaliphilus peptidifermentans]|uniref:Transport permease protein n=1 Tax=Alkaliphilus peptidifermentans DSM 18978 TaxID=1120976 RepID=A0A1G5HB51_9FIRM|nr:ABC transporter permease [Alkaliphilus peptidifermentans]SCY60719.1 ABC-2 type transport system permease protein [Alkaliphilus peptidifermentans DSM 18978]